MCLFTAPRYNKPKNSLTNYSNESDHLQWISWTGSQHRSEWFIHRSEPSGLILYGGFISSQERHIVGFIEIVLLISFQPSHRFYLKLHFFNSNHGWASRVLQSFRSGSLERTDSRKDSDVPSQENNSVPLTTATMNSNGSGVTFRLFCLKKHDIKPIYISVILHPSININIQCSHEQNVDADFLIEASNELLSCLVLQ